jgi:hypothetical protein
MASDVTELLELLARLHRSKTVGYGNAWRKRGELMSIFPNLARKYDRLVVAVDEGVTAKDERLADTAGDLCVYAGKYLTWLAEQQPAAFEATPPHLSAAECQDARGPEALEAIFAALPGWEARAAIESPEDISQAWQRIKTAFDGLEELLDRQQQGEAASAHEKTEYAWAICDASAWQLARIGQRDPQQLQSLRDEIAQMG